MRKVLNSILLFAILICWSCEESKSDKSLASVKVKSNDPLFSLVSSSASGLSFVNATSETDEWNIMTYPYFYGAGGVAIGDVNNDGLQDVYLTACQKPDKLFINKGALKFEEAIKALPDFPDSIWTSGVTMADVNADGWLDIYVSRSGEIPYPERRKNALLINQKDGTFKDMAEQYGLADKGYGTQAAFCDFDKDGDLDMYLLNHQIIGFDKYNKDERNDRDPFVGDKLFRNDGGKFTEIGAKAGINANVYGYGLGVAISDLNNDQWPDIYVTNDFLENDFMYINMQDGSFKEVIKESTKHISNYGMGVDIADVNNDGLQDVFVLDMVAADNYRQKTNMSGMNPERFWQSVGFGFHFQYMYNSLQLNQGSLKFSEVGQLAGVSNTDWSWSCLLADYDLDGYRDLFVTNGLKKEVRNNDYAKEHLYFAHDMPKNQGLDSLTIMWNQLKAAPSTKVPNYIYKNNGDLTFEDKSIAWGVNNPPGFSIGAAYADLDNDGDLDLIANNIDAEVSLYENKGIQQSSGNYLNVSLQGPDHNPFGIGATVTLKVGELSQKSEIYTSRGYQSSVPPMAYFGCGSEAQNARLIVDWPDGRRSVKEVKAFNQTLTISYEAANINPAADQKDEPLLTEVTKALGIDKKHKENYYDDFEDQVLLPHKLSQLGPAIAVADVNGDGLEDFFMGSAHTFKPSMFIQQANGRFKQNTVDWHHENFEETKAEFFDYDGDGDMDLYLATAGYEFPADAPHLRDRIYKNDGQGNFEHDLDALPDFMLNTGCVAPFDYDGDGDLDLFVGGRIEAKKYPLSPRSYLFKNEGGKYSDVTRIEAPDLERVGLVTDAEWIDIDGDKSSELVVVGEWMPVSVFKRVDGRFNIQKEQTTGLISTNGWWFSLAAADIDKDGDLDLIAGNMGLNYKYKASPGRPFRVYANDFDQNQSMDLVLSYNQNGTYYPVRGRECSSQQLPHLKKKFPNYHSFAQASVIEVLGQEGVQRADLKEVHTFAHCVFINENGKFKKRELPLTSQVSSVDDIIVDDLNSDGYPDLLLAGNLYVSEVETPRADASYGNLLLNKGDGTFKAIPPAQTSFFGEGDVAQMKKIDLAEGRVAYLVARNSDELRVFTLR